MDSRCAGSEAPGRTAISSLNQSAAKNFRRLQSDSKFSTPTTQIETFEACEAFEKIRRRRRNSEVAAPAAGPRLTRARGCGAHAIARGKSLPHGQPTLLCIKNANLKRTAPSDPPTGSCLQKSNPRALRRTSQRKERRQVTVRAPPGGAPVRARRDAGETPATM